MPSTNNNTIQRLHFHGLHLQGIFILTTISLILSSFLSIVPVSATDENYSSPASSFQSEYDADAVVAGNDSMTTTQRLKSTLCSDRVCTTKCHSYMTPLNQCYNGKSMYAKDDENPFGGQDAKDVINPDGLSFHRYFYASTDSSCAGTSTDGFPGLPLSITSSRHNCIGPFGAPSPYGYFEIMEKKYKETIVTDVE